MDEEVDEEEEEKEEEEERGGGRGAEKRAARPGDLPNFTGASSACDTSCSRRSSN